MKKKMYEKPTTKVYELKQKCQILAGSPLNNPDDYVDCSDKEDIARYILDMVYGALTDSMFMTFDAFEEFGLLKKGI